MKRIIPCLAAIATFVAASCEKHPASQIDPNYAEKKAEKELESLANQAPEGANPQPPEFFPNKSSE